MSIGRFGRPLGLGVAGATIMLMLAFATSALAVNRFAAPGGTGIAATGCTQSAPESAVCSVSAALAASSAPDDVTLLSGPDYPIQASQLIVPVGITVHGTPGSAPTIPSSAADAVRVSAGASLRDVRIIHSGTGNTLIMEGNTVGERLFVDGGANGAGPCRFGGVGTTLLRDSVCWSQSMNQFGIQATSTFDDSFVVTLRNVTAVSPLGVGLRANALSTSDITINATNVIVRGDSDGTDVEASGSVSAPAIISLDHSNYLNRNAVTGTSITDPATAANVTDPPVFASLASGNFAELSTSTGTIDRGTAGAVAGVGLGPFTVSGGARCLGVAPDIGAEEFAGSPCGTPAPPAAASPATKAKKKCKKKRRKRSATLAKKCKKKRR